MEIGMRLDVKLGLSWVLGRLGSIATKSRQVLAFEFALQNDET